MDLIWPADRPWALCTAGPDEFGIPAIEPLLLWLLQQISECWCSQTVVHIRAARNFGSRFLLKVFQPVLAPKTPNPKQNGRL